MTLPRLLRGQLVLVGICLVLVLYYWLGFQSLGRQVRALDVPLTNAWKELTLYTQADRTGETLSPARFERALQRTEQMVAALDQALEAARQHCQAPPELRERLRAPFQLLEYDRERFRLQAELRGMAETNKVSLDPSVLNAYPEFSSTLSQPTLLWAQLAVVQELALTAVAHRPRALTALVPLPPRLHGVGENRRPTWVEFPVRLEMRGGKDALVNFVRCLPWRVEELVAQGRAALPHKHQALFVEQFLLKNEPGYQNEARLDIVASSFIALE